MPTVGGRVAARVHRLQVEGPGPAGWEHRFCGLEDLKWEYPKWYPEYAGPLWPKLRTLTLEECEDLDLCMLKDLPGLASLSLSCCEDVIYQGLEEPKHYLDLSECFRELKHHLDLNPEPRFRITDAGLKELKHLASLTSLNLSGCLSITDAGLKELNPLASLTFLDMSYCGEVTDAGLKESDAQAP